MTADNLEITYVANIMASISQLLRTLIGCIEPCRSITWWSFAFYSPTV